VTSSNRKSMRGMLPPNMPVVQARLLSSFALTDHRPAELFVQPGADNHGGRMVWVESPGVFMSRLYRLMPTGAGRQGWSRLAWEALARLGLVPRRRYDYLDSEDPTRFCITVSDPDGRLLWRHGEPGSLDLPYCSHQGESLVAFGDLNGDGRQEILVLSGPGRVSLLDACDGRVLRECQLPADNFALVRAGRTGEAPRGWTVLVGVCEAAYPPHSYSNPVLLLDAELQVLKGYDVPGGIGHAVCVFDADGDGLDEFLAGYTLIDDDGRVVWTAEGAADRAATVTAGVMHADAAVIIDGDGVRDWRAAIAGSEATYFFDHRGRCLWKRPGGHSQHVLCGVFRSAAEGPMLFVLHAGGKAEVLDLTGRALWRGALGTNWPLGCPAAVANGNPFHMGRAAAVWRDPLGEGTDLIVYHEGGWPYAVDGFGRRRVEFPCPETARQPDCDVPRRHRPEDYGYGY